MGVALVTGVAGFVGSHTARRLLKSGWVVYGVDNYSKGYRDNINDISANDNFFMLATDIKNPFAEMMKEVRLDCVFHLAAIGDIPFCLANPNRAIEDNIIGTMNVFDVAVKCEAKHIFFADTSAVYDNIHDNNMFPLVEECAPNSYSPSSVYAITKTSAASLLQSYCTLFGIGYTGFRYSNIYGPSMDLTREVPPVIGGFAKALLNKKKPVIYGDGSKIREFVYIDDLVELHYKAAQTYRIDSKINETFNVGSGNPVSILELYNIVWNVCYDIDKDIPEKGDIEWKPNRSNEAQTVVLDSTKVKKCCEWSCRYHLSHGIKETIRLMF